MKLIERRRKPENTREDDIVMSSTWLQLEGKLFERAQLVMIGLTIKGTAVVEGGCV